MSASPTQHQARGPIESTLDEYVAAAKEMWSRPETECRVFETEVVRDRDGRRIGVVFTDADGRRRILRKGEPSGPELRRLIEASA
jgi:hypothetical protein